MALDAWSKYLPCGNSIWHTIPPPKQLLKIGTCTGKAVEKADVKREAFKEKYVDHPDRMLTGSINIDHKEKT